MRVQLISVHDGDTITVADASKNRFVIRLIGIDAPELKQKFGDKSRKALVKILKTDKNNLVVKVFGKDRNRRILAQIFAAETDANLELLKLGAAWFYDSREMKREDWKIYKAAFEAARGEKLGLFTDDAAQNPKEFRQRKSKKRIENGKRFLPDDTVSNQIVSFLKLPNHRAGLIGNFQMQMRPSPNFLTSWFGAFVAHDDSENATLANERINFGDGFAARSDINRQSAKMF